MKVKEESEKAGLKLNIQKMKIMASSPITSLQIDGETKETVTDFIFLGSKITVDGHCSLEFKRCLLLGRNAMANLLLLLLSHFSRVQLCATPQTTAHQAPPSLGFSRQEHWNGLPLPSPMHEKWKVKVKSLSRVRLLATPWTAAHQAPPPMGFSRQEYWSGVPLPSPNDKPRQHIKKQRYYFADKSSYS